MNIHTISKINIAMLHLIAVIIVLIVFFALFKVLWPLLLNLVFLAVLGWLIYSYPEMMFSIFGAFVVLAGVGEAIRRRKIVKCLRPVVESKSSDEIARLIEGWSDRDKIYAVRYIKAKLIDSVGDAVCSLDVVFSDILSMKLLRLLSESGIVEKNAFYEIVEHEKQIFSRFITTLPSEELIGLIVQREGGKIENIKDIHSGRDIQILIGKPVSKTIDLDLV